MSLSMHHNVVEYISLTFLWMGKCLLVSKPKEGQISKFTTIDRLCKQLASTTDTLVQGKTIASKEEKMPGTTTAN